MVLVAAGQFSASANLAHNAKLVSSLLKQASAAGAKVLFLPEASDYISPLDKTVSLAQPVETSEFITGLRQQLLALPEAKRPEISVGIHEPTEDGKKVKNTLVWLNTAGEILHRYQKLHLFDVDVPNGPILRESASVEPGKEVVPPFDTSIGKVGPAICYDIRFPEHALRLRSLGAEILQFPSAFTVRTGYAHWEALARARAIDTQSYVIMAAQVGKHDPEGKRQSYGHTLIVDPWGSVIAQAPDTDSSPRIVLADIDLDALRKIRQDMPLWKQRRDDVFGKV